jgi:hypothetical protein
MCRRISPKMDMQNSFSGWKNNNRQKSYPVAVRVLERSENAAQDFGIMKPGSSTWSSKEAAGEKEPEAYPWGTLRMGSTRERSWGPFSAAANSTGCSKRRPFYPPTPARPRRALSQARPQQVRERGVLGRGTSSPRTKRERRPGFWHHETRQLNMVIQRGRRGERTGGVPSAVRRGFFRAENEVGGHVQLPD